MDANRTPYACSLDAGDLESRLAEIEGIGADALLSHRRDGQRHLLRFGGSAQMRERLEAIIAAETKCCPFLDLELADDGEELVLTIGAPAEAAAVAAALAERFFSP